MYHFYSPLTTPASAYMLKGGLPTAENVGLKVFKHFEVYFL